MYYFIEEYINGGKDIILHHQNALENSGLYVHITWCILNFINYISI